MAELPTDRMITYQRQYRKCNRCRSCREGGTGHGPYVYLYYHEQGEPRKNGKGYKNGRLISRYVGADTTRKPGGPLSEDKVRDIKARLARGERVRSVARSYGVSDSAVSRIKLGKTYRKVTP